MQVDSLEHGGIPLALRFVPGKAPAVVYLTGFGSGLEGCKASRVTAACRGRGWRAR